MPRILYFSRDYSTHDYRFLSALAETEHEIFFLQLEQNPQVMETRSLPPQVNPLKWRESRGLVSMEDLPSLVPELKNIINQVKPDLIQAGPIQRAAFMVALLEYQPLVSMSWGYDLIHDAKINTMWRWITRYTLHQTSLLLGDCETIRKLAVSEGMVDEHIVIFPWGVDLKHFTPAVNRPQSKQSSFTLLSTRNWEPIYGVDVIAHAFVDAARQRPGLKLIMLGGGSQAGYLQNIFEEGEVTSQVEFPGLINFSDLPKFYQNADLYVSASHSDGSSISLLEAFACGTPALVSDIPGNREWVQPGFNGWLFPDSNVAALTEAIIHALENRERLPEMGNSARALAERKANWEDSFQKLLHAYSRVLDIQ